MRPTLFLGLLALICCACSSLPQPQPDRGVMPALGAIGKTEKNWLHRSFQEHGNALLPEVLTVSARAVPFTKAQYQAYKRTHDKQQPEAQAPVWDSITQPSFVILEIADKIALQRGLNHTENSDTRSYLATDPDFGLVTAVKIHTNKALKQAFLKAEMLQLYASDTGVPLLALLGENGQKTMAFPRDAIFDYELSNCCWTKGLRGEKQVAAITVQGRSCPQGTEQKAYKLDAAKSYLKL